MSRELAQHIDRTVTGPMWHGPALAELLDGIPALSANAHPIAGAHSIWELVFHIAAWAEIVQSRLGAAKTPEPTDAENFPAVTATTDEAWQLAVARLKTAYRSLSEAVAILPGDALDKEVPGRGYSVREMLHGAIEHGTYHGGQIAVLKRSLALAP